MEASSHFSTLNSTGLLPFSRVAATNDGLKRYYLASCAVRTVTWPRMQFIVCMMLASCFVFRTTSALLSFLCIKMPQAAAASGALGRHDGVVAISSPCSNYDRQRTKSNQKPWVVEALCQSLEVISIHHYHKTLLLILAWDEGPYRSIL